MSRSRFWGTYGRGIKFHHAGWHIEVCSFTFTDPADWRGLVSWRYRMSRNTITPGVWTDKNPRGRKFETRCFTSKEEARDAAIATAQFAT